MRKSAYALLVVLTFACSSIRAEEIHLKDGTKVNGKIIALNGDTFQVKTAYGEIQIPRAQIVTIGFPENETAGASASDLPVIDETLDGTKYTNRTAKFETVFPDGWRLAPSLRAQSKDISAALESGDQTLFFIVTAEPFAGTLNTYEVLVDTQYQSRFKDYEKLSHSEVQIDRKKGVRFIWRGKIEPRTIRLTSFPMMDGWCDSHFSRLKVFLMTRFPFSTKLRRLTNRSGQQIKRQCKLGHRHTTQTGMVDPFLVGEA